MCHCDPSLCHCYIQVCDDTNQARGFSLIATMAGIGRMLVGACDGKSHPFLLLHVNIQGSITGGFLARPASKYPLFDIPFFCRFPYLLPCLVALVVAIIGLVCKFFIVANRIAQLLMKQNIDGCTSLMGEILTDSILGHLY